MKFNHFGAWNPGDMVETENGRYPIHQGLYLYPGNGEEGTLYLPGYVGMRTDYDDAQDRCNRLGITFTLVMPRGEHAPLNCP